MPTPEPSTEPRSETPALADPTTTMNTQATAKKRKEAFTKLNQNERTAVSIYLLKFIATEKSRIAAAEDKFAMLLKKREEKIQVRVESGKESAETMYPDLYKRYAEHKWLRRSFRLYLTGDGQGQEERDEDDEEPAVPRKRAKLEDVEENIPGSAEDLQARFGGAPRRGGKPASYTETSESDDDREMADGGHGKSLAKRRKVGRVRDAGDEDDEGWEKPVVGTPCLRSYSIRFGYAGLDGVCSGIKAGSSAEEDGVAGGIAVTPGFQSLSAISKKREREGEEGGAAEKKVKV